VLSYVLGVEEAKPRDIEPEQLQRQIALAGRTLIERRLQQEPLLIVIEDLHWADAASIDLLRHVVDHLADRPLMFLLTHRPEARPPQGTRAAHSVIRLGPLSLRDTHALVSELCGLVEGDPLGQLSDLVANRAGGNPLFVEEIVRSLIGKGVLVRAGDHWATPASCQEVDVPSTLQGLLLSRIDQLPAERRRLLQEAAVLGAAFDEALLREVVADAPAAGALEYLVEAELLQPAGAAREGARATGSPTRSCTRWCIRTSCSRAAPSCTSGWRGRWSAPPGAHPERPERPRGARAPLEPQRGQAPGAAICWPRATGPAASTRTRTPSATTSAPSAPWPTVTGATSWRGPRASGWGICWGSPAPGGGARSLRGGARGHRGGRRSRGDGAAAPEDRGLHWEGGDRERAGACFAAGLECLGTEGDPIERAHLFQEMGRLGLPRRRQCAAIAWAERALAGPRARRRPGRPARVREAAAVRVHAYNTLGRRARAHGRPPRRWSRSSAAWRWPRRAISCRRPAAATTNLSVLYSSLDPPRASRPATAGSRSAKKVGDLGFQSRLYANLAVAYCALTDRCEAEGIEAANAAIALDRRLGLLDHLAVPLIVLGQIHQCHGDHALAFASYEEALAAGRASRGAPAPFPCYDGLATLHLDAGDQAQAENFLAKAQAVCERAGLEPDALMVLPFLC
jgi:hypothetical protein